MRIKRTILTVVISATAALASSSTNSGEQNDNEIARGKYLVKIAGCNDCHTSGYASSGASIPENQWLRGDGLGYRGPWGTTYPKNLRKYVAEITEDEWVAKAKTLKARPPMPWWALNAMTESDLRAIYKYIRELGTSNNVVPSFVPPNQEPQTPYIQWPTPPK